MDSRVERPRLTPVDPLVRLAGCGADSEDGSVPGRLPPRLRPDEHERSWRRVDRLAVDLEGRLPVEHDVQLLLARPGLVVLIDQRAVLAGRVGVDSECVDPEVLAHRNVSAAPLDVVEVRDLPRSACRSSEFTSEVRGSSGTQPARIGSGGELSAHHPRA